MEVVEVVITIIVTALWISLFGVIGWVVKEVLGIKIGDENTDDDT